MSDERDSGADPEDAFALVGNETRAAILQELGETPHEGVSFSELRSRVDEDMDSGQFNYHLGKLEGQFVDRTEEGYTLRTEGLTLYRTMRAGTFNRRATIDPFDAGFDCYFCGTGVEAMYGDGTFEIECPGCDHLYVHTTAPPSAVETDDHGAVLSRIDRYNRHRIQAHADGVCPICVHPLETEFRAGEDVWSEGAERLDVFVATDCPYCGNQHFMTVGIALLSHPAVVAFAYDQGIDLEATPHWHYEFAMTDQHLQIRSRDPWAVTLRVPGEDATLELDVDGDLTVRETRRV